MIDYKLGLNMKNNSGSPADSDPSAAGHRTMSRLGCVRPLICAGGMCVSVQVLLQCERLADDLCSWPQKQPGAEPSCSVPGRTRL